MVIEPMNQIRTRPLESDILGESLSMTSKQRLLSTVAHSSGSRIGRFPHATCMDGRMDNGAGDWKSYLS